MSASECSMSSSESQPSSSNRQPIIWNGHGVCVVGVCGKPGAGKDTTGDLLHHSYGFRNLTLKQPIEDAVKAVFGVGDYHLRDREAREKPLIAWPGWTVRKALQAVGQSMRDVVGEDVWGKNLCQRMDSVVGIGSYSKDSYDSYGFVVTDIRTPDDVKTLREHVEGKGGTFILIMVKRDGFGSTTVGGFANHKLESYDLEPACDCVFENNGTIEDLHSKVRGFLRTCFGDMGRFPVGMSYEEIRKQVLEEMDIPKTKGVPVDKATKKDGQ